MTKNHPTNLDHLIGWYHVARIVILSRVGQSRRPKLAATLHCTTKLQFIAADSLTAAEVAWMT